MELETVSDNPQHLGVGTFGECFEYVPENYLFHWYFFSGRGQNIQSWNNSSRLLDYQDFVIIGCQFKGMLLY